MLFATKHNRQFKIDDSEKDSYAAKGYKIVDADGKEVATEFHAPIPYEEHVKLLAEAKKGGKNKDLEAKIKELEAAIAERDAKIAELEGSEDEFK